MGTDRLPRIDLRQRRAQVLTAEVMRVVSPHLCDHQERDPRREVHDALMEAFMAQGVEILSDYSRQEAGLPARGPDGWTLEELMALEKKRLEMLTAPPPALVIARHELSDEQVEQLKVIGPGDTLTVR